MFYALFHSGLNSLVTVFNCQNLRKRKSSFTWDSNVFEIIVGFISIQFLMKLTNEEAIQSKMLNATQNSQEKGACHAI